MSGAVSIPGATQTAQGGTFIGDVLGTIGGATPDAYPFAWVLHPPADTPLCPKLRQAIDALLRDSAKRGNISAPALPMSLQLTPLAIDVMHARRDRLPRTDISAIHVPERLQLLWVYDLPRGRLTSLPWPAVTSDELLAQLKLATESLVLKPDGQLSALKSIKPLPWGLPPGSLLIRIDDLETSQTCLQSALPR